MLSPLRVFHLGPMRKLAIRNQKSLALKTQYSRTSIIQPAIIRNLDYLAWQFSLKMGVSAAVTMDTGMYIFCACADAHIHCCWSIQWVDQGVVYPFDHPVIRPAFGTKVTEVLLYTVFYFKVCSLPVDSPWQPPPSLVLSRAAPPSQHTFSLSHLVSPTYRRGWHQTLPSCSQPRPQDLWTQPLSTVGHRSASVTNRSMLEWVSKSVTISTCIIYKHICTCMHAVHTKLLLQFDQDAKFSDKSLLRFRFLLTC